MTERIPGNPLIVQGDHSVLLEVDNPNYVPCRDELARFAELVKSPEHIHTYRITPLSIWNACAAGVDADSMVGTLKRYSKYPIPGHVASEIRDFASRYGRLKIESREGRLVLACADPALAREIAADRHVAPFLRETCGTTDYVVSPGDRGRIKQALIRIGFPAEDLAGYAEGERLEFGLRSHTIGGEVFTLRSYQSNAAEVFHAGGSARGGSGVVVLPCGAGKTIVGMSCMATIQASTLVLVTNVTAVRQWIAELLDKTTLGEDQVGEYTGAVKEIRPVTISTYQILTYRRSRDNDFEHMALFDNRNWGLIIYDEVHLLPAPVFQVTASLQARRRLGLTATLVREDGRADDVFALIGPKKVDVPWKELERSGWIAKAGCTEIRVPMPESKQFEYAVADPRSKFRIASENPDKLPIVRALVAGYADEQVLVIGMYVAQVKSVAKCLGVPVVCGSTPQEERDRLFEEFRSGALRVLAVSKVANFSVDLPDASVAIQISGTFGSRQEEAQRLGRILRPKPGANQAHFFTVVSHDTREQEFALKRQLFLCEQGYEYSIEYADEAT